MGDDNRNPGRFHHLPALLTGTAALIAALTGVWVNLRENREASPPAPGKPVHLVIQGWRGGLLGFGARPVASGEAMLGGAGVLAIRVQAAKPQDGAFVFHLSAEAVR